MATGIKGTPNTYDFGEDFNYSHWDENTVLTLVTVPWNSDYRDVWRATSKSAFDSYIDGRPGKLSIPNVSLAKFNRNVRINTPLNAAMKYNYLRASNPLMPIDDDVQRNYYYFIQDVAYISPNTTELLLQLDVWQTFGYDVTFGNCYVERGHIGIANTNAFQNYGRNYLNIPEGLDTGGEYRIVRTESEAFMDMADGSDQYSVLICSVVDLTKDPGNKDDPKLTTAPGGNIDNLPTGATFYVFPSGDDFRKFMKEYGAFPWITQGIISIKLIPNILRYFPGATLTNVASDVHNAIDLSNGGSGDGGVIIVSPPDYVMYKYPSGRSGRKVTALADNWRDSFLNFLPAQYRILKKLLTYPYSVVELTTWTGKAIAIRPEAWADDDATVWEQAVMLPPSQRIAFIPYRYNADPQTSAASHDDNGEYLDMSTTVDNFPSVPIVNNMAINYLASNMNGLAWQNSSADWSQQRALQGAGAAYSNAEASGANVGRQAAIGNRANAASTELAAQTLLNSNAIGVGSSMLGGAMGAAANPMNAGALPGALTGAAASALQAGVQADAISQGGSISRSARSQSASATQQNIATVADTNYKLANNVAYGDYQNTIAGINAKIQDSRLTQPSTAGQFGGDAMNLTHGNAEVSARWKFIDDSTVKQIGNFWLRYGYAIHQFIQFPSSFHCMSKFTYWKLSETYIVNAPIPEQFKQTIRGIFEKGVTVWQQPQYIGQTAVGDNVPLGGISY